MRSLQSHTHTHTHFLSSCLTLQQPSGRRRALEARSLAGPEEVPGPVGQRHPEGKQLLLSPPLLPLLLPPHLLLFLLAAVLMLGFTTVEPLPHFDQGDSGRSVQAGSCVRRRWRTACCRMLVWKARRLSLPGLSSDARRIDES